MTSQQSMDSLLSQIELLILENKNLKAQNERQMIKNKTLTKLNHQLLTENLELEQKYLKSLTITKSLETTSKPPKPEFPDVFFRLY